MINTLERKKTLYIDNYKINNLVISEILDRVCRIESYYKYFNSIFGILESINKDYQNLNLEATEIQKALSDPENMGLLRDILTKLG